MAKKKCRICQGEDKITSMYEGEQCNACDRILDKTEIWVDADNDLRELSCPNCDNEFNWNFSAKCPECETPIVVKIIGGGEPILED